VRVSGSVEEENVLKLTLKLCAPKGYHEEQCEGERECGGRKCHHTQTQTLCAKGLSHWLFLKIAGARTCAPKAYHEEQCEVERECGGRKCPHTHTGFF